MANETMIHVAMAGTVQVAVYRDHSGQADYHVRLTRASHDPPSFGPDELAMVCEAIKQADLFIKYDEQIARMNWCPGCGNG